jgi:3D (Asp-Asp-Asp) domain-containing protein
LRRSPSRWSSCFFYETTTRDSRYAARDATLVEATSLPQAGARLQFTATAYCKGDTTASGVGVRTGVAAADPQLLPVGTVVRVDLPNPATAASDGHGHRPAVQGRTVDLYLWSCKEALEFGRRQVRLTVLRLGWNPQNSIPGWSIRCSENAKPSAHTPAPAPATPPPIAPESR